MTMMLKSSKNKFSKNDFSRKKPPKNQKVYILMGNIIIYNY